MDDRRFDQITRLPGGQAIVARVMLVSLAAQWWLAGVGGRVSRRVAGLAA